jgi:hypothetical protein
VRVHVSDASLVGDFCEHLAQHGFVAVEVDEHDADVLIPWEEDEFFAAMKLSFEVSRWQAEHASVAVDRE